MYVMQAHARTGPVAVADLEKMLGKVPWLLGEVSLYAAGECANAQIATRKMAVECRLSGMNVHGDASRHLSASYHASY